MAQTVQDDEEEQQDEEQQDQAQQPDAAAAEPEQVTPQTPPTGRASKDWVAMANAKSAAPPAQKDWAALANGKSVAAPAQKDWVALANGAKPQPGIIEEIGTEIGKRATEGYQAIVKGGKQIADAIAPPHQAAAIDSDAAGNPVFTGQPAAAPSPDRTEQLTAPGTTARPSQDDSTAEVVREHQPEPEETGAWAGVKSMAKGAMGLASTVTAPVGVLAGKGAELSERSTGALTDVKLDARIARAEALKRDYPGAAGSDADVNALGYLKKIRAMPYAQRIEQEKQQAGGIAEDVALQAAAGVSPFLRGLKAARAEEVGVTSGLAPFKPASTARAAREEAGAALGDYNPPRGGYGAPEPTEIEGTVQVGGGGAPTPRTVGQQHVLDEAERIAAGSNEPIRPTPDSQRRGNMRTMESAEQQATSGRPLDFGTVGRRRAQQLAQRVDEPTPTDPAPEINRPDTPPMRVVAEDGTVVHDTRAPAVETAAPKGEPVPEPTTSAAGDTTPASPPRPLGASQAPAPPTPQDLSDSFFPEHPEGAPTGTRTSARIPPNISGASGLDLLAKAREEDGFLNLGAAVDTVRDWWRQSWLRDNLPMESMVLRARAGSTVISDIERWSTGLADSLREDVATSSWWKAIRNRTPDELNAYEKDAVDAWNAGDRTPQALQQAMGQWPQDLQDYVRYRNLRLQGEQAARAYLGLDPVPEVSGLYLPRITDREAMDIQRVGGRLGVGTGLQTTVKDAMHQRTFATQLDGEAAGMKYIDRRNAMLQREWNSLKLSYTAKLVHDLEGKALFRTAAQARAASPTGEAFALEGVPGDARWWTPTKEEGRFLVQNLDAQPTGGVASFKHYGDALFRNPNLINPLPHITKNMGMKYLLARGPIGSWQLARDAVELWRGTAPDLIARFKEVMPFSDSPQGAFATLRNETVRGSAGTAVQRVETALRTINTPAQTAIFQYADPAMRYSLWKHYLAEGMSDQQAANHAWIDLVRYGTRSYVTDLWKSIPMNFFVPWRVGTVTSLFKQMAYHPIRTALTVGAVDYLREMRYRQTGRWTHLPWDYVEGPMADVIQHLHDHDVAGLTWQGLTTAAFGPVGETTANSISKLLDPNQQKVKRVLWGLSQFSDTRDEWRKFEKDGQTSHLVNIVMGALAGERSTLVQKPGNAPTLYEPKRFEKFLPEVQALGLKKFGLLKGAENLQRLAKTKAAAKVRRQGGVLASAWKQVKDLASEVGFAGRPGSYSVPPEDSQPQPETDQTREP